MQADRIAIWEFPSGADGEVMASIVAERRDEPDAVGVVVSARGPVVTLQVVEGAIVNPRSTLFVEGRGGHVLERREAWPPAAPGSAPRELLVLRSASAAE
jgi:hypothetical protein